jgi:2-polyprenyl-3-methyl-5-hydroxy-6-metoxy-1,4-benzoquinol methylase
MSTMKENKTKSVLVHCAVCSSKNTVELYPANIDVKKISFTYEFSPQSQKTFRVVKCRNCSHVFCAPLPKDLYKNYEDVIDHEYLRHTKTRELSAEAVVKVIKQYKPTGKLLDVGCATGDFLDVAKHNGYSVEGLELSKWSYKIAQSRGFTIHRKTLKTLASVSRNVGKYDVITLWGVIEHFENPQKEMQYLNKLLKPGGYLILWTGNVEGLMSKLLGRKWWYWQGQHIQYFTEKSLTLLGTNNGFEHLATKRYPIAATIEQMENSLSRYKRSKYITPFLRLAFSTTPIWYLRLPGEMFWIARKKNGKN